MGEISLGILRMSNRLLGMAHGVLPMYPRLLFMLADSLQMNISGMAIAGRVGELLCGVRRATGSISSPLCHPGIAGSFMLACFPLVPPCHRIICCGLILERFSAAG